jgi:PP-loop superfamily ATP-utilizing enzyme
LQQIDPELKVDFSRQNRIVKSPFRRAYACQATRLLAWEEITPEKLAAVEQAGFLQSFDNEELAAIIVRFLYA